MSETNVYEAGTGAVRSNDLAVERWDLLSGAACRQLYLASGTEEYDQNPLSLVGEAINFAQAFLGFDATFRPERLDILTRGWWKLAAAIQLLDMDEGVGALKARLAVVDISGRHYPYYALRRAATTCHEGAVKYAEENWHHGFQIKSLANHAIPHMISWSNGRKTGDDELGHAMWGFMAMTHMWLFRQDMCSLLLGKNYTITEELQKMHDEHASRRTAAKQSRVDPHDALKRKINEELTKRQLTSILDSARYVQEPVSMVNHA